VFSEIKAREFAERM